MSKLLFNKRDLALFSDSQKKSYILKFFQKLKIMNCKNEYNINLDEL